ncbi:bifunctional DNA primase/polymerase [Pseudonocardia sp. 1LY6.1]
MTFRTRYMIAVGTYADRGFTLMPVAGKSVPPIGVTGSTGRDIDTDDVSRWSNHPDPAYNNVAIRHTRTIAIDVDEGYGNKDGVAQLAKLAERNRLPALPATYSSTARGAGSGSRQYLYRVPSGEAVDAATRLKSNPCPSVEVCYRNHRFTVAFPSKHPDTGDVYHWYLPGDAGTPPSWGDVCTDENGGEVPEVSALAELPREWWTFLSTNRQMQNPHADRIAVTGEDDLLALFRPAHPEVEAAPLRRIRETVDTLSHVGHDTFFAQGLACLEHGVEGVPGAGELYQGLKSRCADYLDSVGRPADELPRMVDEIVDRVQRRLTWRECIGMTGSGEPVYRSTGLTFTR